MLPITERELLTESELRRALNIAGEPDNSRYCWIIHDADVSSLVDILNAMQVQHAAKDMLLNAKK